MEGEIEEQKIAPLLFIPFIENSFKHGLATTQTDEGFINLNLVGRRKVFISGSKITKGPRQYGKKTNIRE